MSTLDRDQLSGSLVAGIFGIAWAQWAAADLPPGPGGIVRLLGLVAGVIVIVRSSQRRAVLPTGHAQVDAGGIRDGRVHVGIDGAEHLVSTGEVAPVDRGRPSLRKL
jgi:hypothetical protein